MEWVPECLEPLAAQRVRRVARADAAAAWRCFPRVRPLAWDKKGKPHPIGPRHSRSGCGSTRVVVVGGAGASAKCRVKRLCLVNCRRCCLAERLSYLRQDGTFQAIFCTAYSEHKGSCYRPPRYCSDRRIQNSCPLLTFYLSLLEGYTVRQYRSNLQL